MIDLPFGPLSPLIVVALAVLLVFLFYRWIARLFGVVIIPEDSIGIVNKKYVVFGKNRTLPDGAIVALNGEAGLQADTLAPGLHFWLWPWQYIVTRQKFITIAEDTIGVVEARDGQPAEGRPRARAPRRVQLVPGRAGVSRRTAASAVRRSPSSRPAPTASTPALFSVSGRGGARNRRQHGRHRHDEGRPAADDRRHRRPRGRRATTCSRTPRPSSTPAASRACRSRSCSPAGTSSTRASPPSRSSR